MAHPNNEQHDQPVSKPDPGTEHTTDPEDHMEGPISSLMQNIKGGAEKEDVKNRKEDGSKRQED